MAADPREITEAECALMVRLHRDGANTRKIATALGATSPWVVRQLGNLGLVPNTASLPSSHGRWPDGMRFEDDRHTRRDPGSGPLPPRPPTVVPKPGW